MSMALFFVLHPKDPSEKSPPPFPCSIFFSLVPRKFKLGSEFLEKLGLRPKIERNEKINILRGRYSSIFDPPPFYVHAFEHIFIHTHACIHVHVHDMDTRVKRKRAQVGTIENYQRSISFVGRLVSNRNLLFQWSLTPFKCM